MSSEYFTNTIKSPWYVYLVCYKYEQDILQVVCEQVQLLQQFVIRYHWMQEVLSLLRLQQ